MSYEPPPNPTIAKTTRPTMISDQPGRESLLGAIAAGGFCGWFLEDILDMVMNSFLLPGA
ncbi:hypothetical protein [Gloeocapsopsis sp. IPPAS B-1203]|uniref:hypothetical protein n=1 Tax=Gloeocapsopsis sp. IPPAS B-1203 TaxID=2049454 RepID=UPI0025A1D5BF|nr:hypothetical protein [Gloeocapsopsis sp. IPPAS B-1203]